MALPFRAVLFDLDGTLADSLGDIGGAMNEALAARGLLEHPLIAYHQFIGEGVEVLARRAAPLLEEMHVLKLVDEYRERYAARIDSATRPYEGISELLDGLVAAQIPLAVLSNKRDDFTVELVRRRFSRWPFRAVRGERADVPRKPDPAAALEIAATLGVNPADCAFVGDTAIDMKTATAAGMQPVGVLWGFRGREELLAAGAKRLIARPAELLNPG
jgi:phosphoglycolate phosphatase